MLRRLKELLVCLLNLFSVQFSKTIFFIALKRLSYLTIFRFVCQHLFFDFQIFFVRPLVPQDIKYDIMLSFNKLHLNLLNMQIILINHLNIFILLILSYIDTCGLVVI